MKTFKVTFATLAFALCASFASAQETPQQKADKQTQRMTEELQLTPNQKAQVAEINLAIAQKNEAVRNDNSLSQETKQQSYKGNNEARMQMIKPLLTAEQVAKFEQMESRKAEVQQAKFKPDFSQFEQKQAAPEGVQPSKN